MYKTTNNKNTNNDATTSKEENDNYTLYKVNGGEFIVKSKLSVEDIDKNNKITIKDVLESLDTSIAAEKKLNELTK